MKKGIAVLGSTGSIGRQTLEVISSFPEDFRIIGLATKGYLDLLKKQTKQFSPKHVCISDDDYDYLAFPEYKTIVYRGQEGLIRLAEDPATDTVVMSIVGTAGLEATLAAVKAGKTVALASKEILVAAGDLIMNAAKKYRTKILPVDSEHSAVFQCLNSQQTTNNSQQIKRIILTASGGPFRKYSKKQLSKVTAKQALNHPTWKMGPKITVDSATLMNKGLEVIEAHHLFNMPYEKIDVVVHPQCIIHSMVEFMDGSIIAQLGIPDMRTPIQYALTYPERKSRSYGSVDFTEIGSFTFEKPDLERFPSLSLAYKAGKTGGTLPAVLSAANDTAVDLFMNDKIKFTDIPDIVASAMRRHKTIKNPSLSQILLAQEWAREEARNI